MSTYAIGDIHGCFSTFERLLGRIQFDPSTDQLWLCGDLVNGGPDSLGMLRWCVRHDHCVNAVLGNHDLHLLAVAAGAHTSAGRDTLEPILAADDRLDLLDWLGQQPLVRHAGDVVMVHAGLLAAWTLEQALEMSAKLEAVLAGDQAKALLESMYDPPSPWGSTLDRWDRLNTAINAMTRLRVVDTAGEMAFDFCGPLEDLPDGRVPWFDAASERFVAAGESRVTDDSARPLWDDHRVIFGHWAALGLHKVGPVICLDSGCVWGGKLTAIRLEDDAIFQVTSERPKTV